MRPGIFTFSRACFNFVSKQLKHLDLVNFCHVSIRFLPVSPFQFFPYIIHCFSVSKQQK